VAVFSLSSKWDSNPLLISGVPTAIHASTQIKQPEISLFYSKRPHTITNRHERDSNSQRLR
jgi:hypothetical protein